MVYNLYAHNYLSLVQHYETAVSTGKSCAEQMTAISSHYTYRVTLSRKLFQPHSPSVTDTEKNEKERKKERKKLTTECKVQEPDCHTPGAVFTTSDQASMWPPGAEDNRGFYIYPRHRRFLFIHAYPNRRRRRQHRKVRRSCTAAAPLLLRHPHHHL